MSDIIIRPARPEEHAELVGLAKLSRYTKDFSNTQMFSSEAAYNKGWILVARGREGELLGFTCVRHKTREPVTVLYFVGVSEAARRRGVATRLLDAIMAGSPHRVMRLNVMKDNDAVEFYRTLGFSKVGESLKGAGWSMERVWLADSAENMAERMRDWRAAHSEDDCAAQPPGSTSVEEREQGQ